MSVVGIFSINRYGDYSRCESAHISVSKFSEFLAMYKPGNTCYSFANYTWYIDHDCSGFRCIVTEFSFNHLEAPAVIRQIFKHN